MIPEIFRIAQLQLEYSSENTPAMQERGRIIRDGLPNVLRRYFDRFKETLGRFGDSLEIEGRDGIGRKTEAAWVRLYSKKMSPSATKGFYVVIHFDIFGKTFYVTLGCGATTWDSEKGDLVKDTSASISKKVSWAKSTLARFGQDTSGFPDIVFIGSKRALPKKFEEATVLAKALSPFKTEIDEFISSVNDALKLLSVIYESVSQRADVKSSENIESDIQELVNPLRYKSRKGQGFRLTPPERRAIELRAMRVTELYLKSLGYTLEDTSSSYSFDFLAKALNKVIKVEVKGTTSLEVDSILMTSNEVKLHTSEAGNTALAIVSGISFLKRGKDAQCEGGVLEFFSPWQIQEWVCMPTAYKVMRSSTETHSNK